MGFFGDLLSDVGDAIYDAGYNLSLQPTIWSIEHEARKLDGTSSSNTTKVKNNSKPQSQKPVAKKVTKVENKKAVSTSKEKSDDEKIKALEKELAELKKRRNKEKKESNVKKDNTKPSYNKKKYKELKGTELVTKVIEYMTINKSFGTVSEEEKGIINGIASIFNFDKIFKNVDTVDLRDYDLRFNSNAIKKNYIFDLEKISEIKKIDGLMKLIDFNKSSLISVVTKDDKKDDDIIHQVFFDDSIEREANDSSAIPMKGKGISNNLFKKLEKTFLPFMGKTYHRYEKEENGFIDMFYSNGSEAGGMIRIDPGLVMGKGRLYVLANFSNDICFVDTEHHDIITKILNNNFYQLTPDEYQVVVDGLFRNTEHYQYYDLSNTSFLGKLSSEEFQKLGKKLTFVSAKLALERTNDAVPRPEIQPRLRLTNWKSVDNFDLISDERVISPLHNSQQTFGVVELGLKVEVRKDDVIEYKNNKMISKYHIDKYGNM